MYFLVGPRENPGTGYSGVNYGGSAAGGGPGGGGGGNGGGGGEYGFMGMVFGSGSTCSSIPQLSLSCIIVIVTLFFSFPEFGGRIF